MVPRFLVAIIVILLGLLVAKIAEKTIKVLFERLKIDALLERTGFTGALKRMGMSGSPGRLLARSVYILLMVLFTQSVCRAVGLDVIADAIGAFFSYLPNLAAAFMVLLLGMMVSQFLGRAITTSAEESGLEYGPMLGRAVSSLVMFVVVIMAISQLRIDTGIIRMVVLVVLSGVAIAVALSFGLGTRDITRNIVAGFYVRRLLREGDELEIDGQRGHRDRGHAPADVAGAGRPDPGDPQPDVPGPGGAHVIRWRNAEESGSRLSGPFDHVTRHAGPGVVWAVSSRANLTARATAKHRRRIDHHDRDRDARPAISCRP